jgi:beta-N-acetylhexosaminidase
LLIASDLERGTGQQIGGMTVYPPLMALGATGSEDLAYRTGYYTARQARACGFWMTFSPVLDVNDNPDNPIINVRSFGEDPALVALLGRGFITGCRDGDLLATAKHFPGHGDTDVDSHTGLPVIGKSRDEIERTELVPFREAVEAGVGAVMVGHLAVPALDSSLSPATFSRSIIEGVLRGDLGFEGLVVTDALVMDAAKNGERSLGPCPAALAAGADILLMPERVDSCLDAITAAVRNGAVEEQMLDTAVRRLLARKRRFLDREHPAAARSASAVETLVREGNDVAAEVARRSLTLLRNDGSMLPLDRSDGRTLAVTFRGDSLLTGAGLFHDVMRESLGEEYTSMSVLPGADSLAVRRIVEEADAAELLIIVAVSRVRAYTGYPGLPGELLSLIGKIRGDRKTVLLSFGNPYIVRDIPTAPVTLIAYGTDAHSQRAAANALLGKFPIRGRLPVTIPGRFDRGSGLTLDAGREGAGP